MLTKIVVGADGRDGGSDALALALALADPAADIILVNAFPYDEVHLSRGSSLGYEHLIREDAEGILRKAADVDPRIRTRAVPDLSPARALQAVAEEVDADLIVVGSCHRSALGRVLLGDVSRDVLHGAHCPVAVAPQGYRDHAAVPAKIGVGFTATPESRVALEFASSLAEQTGAHLQLVTAVSVPWTLGASSRVAFGGDELLEARRTAARESLDQAMADTAVAATSTVTEGAAGEALEALAGEVDLVVAGSRGWGAARRVLLGSATSHLVHHAACPVIVVPGLAEERDSASQGLTSGASAG